MPEPVIESGQKVLFIGDSITDCGRRGDFKPLGAGYVAAAVNIFTARHPELEVDWENRGIGGNTVVDLDGRWREDCLDLAPDCLSVMIGINDAARYGRTPAGAVSPPDVYRATYDRILAQARDEVGCRLILMEPFYITLDETDPVSKVLPEYLATVAELAASYEAILVRTHEAFQKALPARSEEMWAADRVHPGGEGHALAALEWLEAVGA
jgi:lysophospholipase L1-like esterase